YILLDEHKFQVLADEGINAKVEKKVWDEIANQMAEKFKNGEYLTGVVTTVMRIGEILAGWFPRKSDDTNELSNEVHIV
ncbi:MAG: TPM domain-containing protein, partial [Candidatus Marinimicrobia bacterium]|nr:TPM domain-containing protein [Candidatus Neomarinimicrobiota bacterium]